MRPALKPRKPRVWQYPRAIERSYTADLVSLADEIERLVRAEVWPVLRERADAIEDIPESSGWFESLRRAFVRVTSAIDLSFVPNLVAGVAERLAGQNKQQFHTIVKAAYGVDVLVAEPWLPAALKAWESQNVGLIKSIPSQALDRMHGKIVNAVQAGRLVPDVQKEIEREFGVTRDRAKLIANDQIGKLQGQLTQARQQELGVDEYVWRGMLDGRERDEHRDREGQRFKWSKPPPDGHPGQPIRCRCYAEPVLPLFADLLPPTIPL